MKKIGIIQEMAVRTEKEGRRAAHHSSQKQHKEKKQHLRYNGARLPTNSTLLYFRIMILHLSFIPVVYRYGYLDKYKYIIRIRVVIWACFLVVGGKNAWLVLIINSFLINTQYTQAHKEPS